MAELVDARRYLFSIDYLDIDSVERSNPLIGSRVDDIRGFGTRTGHLYLLDGGKFHGWIGDKISYIRGTVNGKLEGENRSSVFFFEDGFLGRGDSGRLFGGHYEMGWESSLSGFQGLGDDDNSFSKISGMVIARFCSQNSRLMDFEKEFGVELLGKEFCVSDKSTWI